MLGDVLAGAVEAAGCGVTVLDNAADVVAASVALSPAAVIADLGDDLDPAGFGRDVRFQGFSGLLVMLTEQDVEVRGSAMVVMRRPLDVAQLTALIRVSRGGGRSQKGTDLLLDERPAPPRTPDARDPRP